MTPRLPRLTAAELLRALKRDGWTPTRQRGSHVILRHATKPGGVTVPLHEGTELRPATLASILEQAGLSVDDLERLL